MPIELGSGNVKLTDDEITLYTPAAALITRAFGEQVAMHLPMTRSQFAILYFAHAVVTDDHQLMLEIVAIFEGEIEQRKRPH
jgi:hypothetical protein